MTGKKQKRKEQPTQSSKASDTKQKSDISFGEAFDKVLKHKPVKSKKSKN